MKAPLCEICGNTSSGEYVEFANYQPLPPGYCGHPQGLEWFCKAHLRAARRARKLSSYEAIKRIKKAQLRYDFVRRLFETSLGRLWSKNRKTSFPK